MSLVLALGLAVSGIAPGQSILTFAGGGTDDGRLATRLHLASPQGIAADAEGNLFVADTDQHRILRIDARTGVSTILAGQGIYGDGGDGGPAARALFARPTGLAWDPAGRLYVADRDNYRIRRIDLATGLIDSLPRAFNGHSLIAPEQVSLDFDGNVYFTNYGSWVAGAFGGSVSRWNRATGSVTDLLSLDNYVRPKGLAVDGSRNVFIAVVGESGVYPSPPLPPSRILRLDAKTGSVTVVAGGEGATGTGDGIPATQSVVNSPRGLAITATGDLLISESGNDRVRKIHAASGIITTVAGGGSPADQLGDGIPATQARLRAPAAVALLPGGSFVIADQNNARVRRVDGSTGTISTVAGGPALETGDGGPATAAFLRGPKGVVLDDDGNLLIVESRNNRIRKVDVRTGTITTVAGTGVASSSGDGGLASAAGLLNPVALARDASGNLFLAEGSGAYRVRRIDARTGIIQAWAGGGSDTIADGVPATAARLYLGGCTAPPGQLLAVDRTGALLIADLCNRRIRRVDPGTRLITTIAGTGKFSDAHPTEGALATSLDLGNPNCVAVGPDGAVYFPDSAYSQRPAMLWRIDPSTGRVSSRASGLSWYPSAVAWDATGTIHVAEGDNNRVVRIGPAGTPLSVAGRARTQGNAGDGGPAADALLSSPDSICFAPGGDLLIGDSTADRVRVIPACRSVAAPALSSPAEGATTGAASVTFSWQAVAGAFRYDLLLDTTASPSKVVASDLVATSFTASNLSPGTVYRWVVVAKGDPFCTLQSKATSAVRVFQTPGGCKAPPAAALQAPAEGATVTGTSVTLQWLPAEGAGSYDVAFGASSPPPIVARGQSATSLTVPGLVAGASYRWGVTARAACDATRATSSSERTFQVAGACASPAAFATTSPANGATVTGPRVTFAWARSNGASNYDFFLGRDAAPPLHAAGLQEATTSVDGLVAGATYFWKVVARSSCSPAIAETPVARLSLSGACSPPPAPSIVIGPPGPIAVGQTYVLAWTEPPGLAPGSIYEVVRSADASFAAVLDRQVVSDPSASFVPLSPGLLHHRVRALPSCNPQLAGAWSPARQATVSAERGNVVVTRAPRGVVLPLGATLEDVLDVTFTVENIGTAPLTVSLGRNEVLCRPFFQVEDPEGGGTDFVSLPPRVPKTFRIRFSGPPSSEPGAYQGIVNVAGAGLPVLPYAYVSLRIGGAAESAPAFRVGGVPSEYASFPPFAGTEDLSRPSLSVEVVNTGNTPLELAAEVGPEVWLSLAKDWNASPVAPGSSRTIPLTTRRVYAPAGSSLPRYTYLTVRTKGGASARLLVQDNDVASSGGGRGGGLDLHARSYVVPSVVRGPSKIGGEFVSRVRLTNVGGEPVEADLVFTPASTGSTLRDGFDATVVRRAKVVVPPNDSVSLTDPLVQLFGLQPPAVGLLEVRADPSRIGALTVTSSVDAPSSKGGSFGFQVPVLRRGEGATRGRPHVVPAIALTPSSRSNLILAETSGLDSAAVRVVLVNAAGATLGETTVTVPRYGQRQISLSDLKGAAAAVTAGTAELWVTSGDGTVAGMVTVIDNFNDDASALVSRPVGSGSAVSRTASASRPASAGSSAASTVRSGIPSIVNGYRTFPGTDLPYTFRTQLTLKSIGSAAATFRFVYTDLSQGGTKIERSVTVPGRTAVEYSNAVEELFGVPAGQPSQGPLLVESEPHGLLTCRVYSILANGTLGDSFPVIALPPDPQPAVTGPGLAWPLSVDGLEQSVDATRGTRTNLILNEWTGKPAKVSVSLYEAGNRTCPIAEREIALGALEKVQLSTVFRELGLDTEERRKDRTNVLCVVRPVSGEGLVSAVVTTIDNRTGDTRNASLLPSGGTSGPGVAIEF